MAKTSSSSNANSAAVLHSGSAGETLTSANLAISVSAMETMSASIQRISCLSVQGLVPVRSEEITTVTENRKCWDVPSVATSRRTVRVFEQRSYLIGQLLININ